MFNIPVNKKVRNKKSDIDFESLLAFFRRTINLLCVRFIRFRINEIIILLQSRDNQIHSVMLGANIIENQNITTNMVNTNFVQSNQN